MTTNQKHAGLKSLLTGRNVLVTGGTGSIGSEIVRQALLYQPRVVRILSRDEHKQYELQHALRNYSNVRYLIGDVRSQERLEWALEGIDIVFHAAAMKHVPACEYNPWEAVETNVLGTQHVVKAALKAPTVERVVCISTDKAVAPVGVLGASKLLAEKITTRANFYSARHQPLFCSVRFGNVMNTRGNFVARVVEQIASGGPVTLTDDGMTRFMMSLAEAVHLVLTAALMTRGGEVFIFKMPVVRIQDVIKVMIAELAPRYGYQSQHIRIKTVGSRPGEKTSELLLTAEEAQRCLETPEMFILLPPPREGKGSLAIDPRRYPRARRMKEQAVADGAMTRYLSPTEIVSRLLKPAGLLDSAASSD